MAKKEIETFLQGAGRPVEVLWDSQVKGPWKLTLKELQMVLPGPHHRPGARGAEGPCSSISSALLPCPHDPAITAWGPNGPNEFQECCSCPVLSLEDVGCFCYQWEGLTSSWLFLLDYTHPTVPHIHNPTFTLDLEHTYK